MSELAHEDRLHFVPYLHIVRHEVVEVLGGPVFLNEAVGVVLREVSRRAEKCDSKMALPEKWVRKVARAEARKLNRAIENKFMREGKLELPAQIS